MKARFEAAALCLLLLGACAATGSGPSIVTTAPSGVQESIPAQLLRPEGPGPFPAVVMMHDCSGLGPRSSGAPGRWASELVAHGYVVVLPDSFSTRGFPGGVCTDPSPERARVGPRQRMFDAYAALAYLRTLPFVDGARVGLMGGSHGGNTTLVSVVASKDTAGRAPGFSAAVALYPGCKATLGNWHADLTGVYKPLAPLLILVGELDDWTPAEPCRRLADAAQKAGYPVAIKIYPGAYHSFDSGNPPHFVAARVNASSPSGHGATTGGNPEAWADSIREVLAFFGRNLAPAGR
jgi:dienelactone hydrolase